MLNDRSVFACEEDCRFIGTGAALLTSALIGAGTSAAEGAIQSHQTSKAVDAQTAATNQAIANLKPFQDTGTKAFTTLGALMGLGGGGGAQAQAGAPASTANTPWGGTVMDDGQRGSITDPNKQPNAAVNGAGQFIGNLSQSQRAQDPATTSSYSTPGMHGSSTQVPQITMKAPDGSTNSVPADQVGYWTSKGAKVVGNG
jgi:hypothetical protein